MSICWTRREFCRQVCAAEEVVRLANPENSANIVRQLRALGFVFVTVDLAGYQTGSLNQLLTEQEKQG